MDSFFSLPKLSPLDEAVLKLQNQQHILGRLSLASSSLDDAMIEKFTAAVARNTTVLELTIEECRLTPTGMQKVAEALKLNRTLTCILFCNNASAKKGWLRALESLHTRFNPTLREISIDVIDETVDATIAMLNNNQTLHKVFMILSVTSWTPFIKMFDCVAQHRHLKKFSISSRRESRTFDSVPFIDALVRLLEQNQFLWSLKLYALPTFTEANRERIKTAFKNNFSLREFNFASLESTFIKSIEERNSRLQWGVIHPRLLDLSIAMSPLNLPPYVLLWIIDFLPEFAFVSHHRKIHLLESIARSIRKIRHEDEDNEMIE